METCSYRTILSLRKQRKNMYIKKNFTVNVNAKILCLNFCCNTSIKYRDTFCCCHKLGYHPDKAFTPPPCSHRLVVIFPPRVFRLSPCYRMLLLLQSLCLCAIAIHSQLRAGSLISLHLLTAWCQKGCLKAKNVIRATGKGGVMGGWMRTVWVCMKRQSQRWCDVWNALCESMVA